jgi:methylglutaconyl-CoA hydratase
VVINLVHGNSFGGALGFIGAGDLTFAVKNARFCFPELRLGLVPSVIMPYLLTRVKLPDIKYQILSGGIFTAEDALKIGLVDKVCEDFDDMEMKTNEIIQNIYSASPKAITSAKTLLRTLNKSLINSDNIRETVKIITRMKMSDDAKSRMLKFATKKSYLNKRENI